MWPSVSSVSAGSVTTTPAKLVDRGATLVGGMDIDADARRRFHEEFDVHAYEDESDLYEGLRRRPDHDAEPVPRAVRRLGARSRPRRALGEAAGAHRRKRGAHRRAARDAEGFCMIGFNNRFAEPVQVLKGYQAEGRFGETTHVEANYVRRRGIPGRGSWFTSRMSPAAVRSSSIGVPRSIWRSTSSITRGRRGVWRDPLAVRESRRLRVRPHVGR